MMGKSLKFFTIMMTRIISFVLIVGISNSCVVPADGYFGPKPHAKVQLVNKSDHVLTFSSFYEGKPSLSFGKADSMFTIQPGGEYYFLDDLTDRNSHGSYIVNRKPSDSIVIQIDPNDILIIDCDSSTIMRCVINNPSFHFLFRPEKSDHRFKARIDKKRVISLETFEVENSDLIYLKNRQ